MKRNYAYRKQKHPFFNALKVIMNPLLKRPKIINYNKEILDKSIILCPHCGKWGPLSLSFNFPKKTAIWGAHEMLEDYKTRRKYLIEVLYMQKLKRKRFFSSIKASFEAIFNVMIYKGMMIIPTYQDMRFVNTIKYSIETIKNDIPVLIFPEDSSDGYFEYLKSCLPGFITLAERYQKKVGERIPIYLAYYNYSKKILIIDKPVYIDELKNQGLYNDQICEWATNKINILYKDYLESKQNN